MRQRDKKKDLRYRGRLRNISLPDINILDEKPDTCGAKSARISSKIDDSYKSDSILQKGRILRIMSNYQCLVELQGEDIIASISGRLKQFLYSSHNILSVGDYVWVDTSVEPDYRIEKLEPRRNLLTRYGAGSFQKEIMIAANIDNLVITTSWLMPRFKAGLVDRYLILAAKHGISPILVVNKIDLCEDREELEEEIAYFRQIGCRVVLSSIISGEGIAELKELLKDKDSVFSGHSGAGKSSLINALEPGLDLETAEVSDYNEKGKHTTTHSLLIRWSFGGHLLDTPGIKTITLHQNDRELIPRLFPGFQRYHPYCKFRDCTHSHETDCAVIRALEAGEIEPSRYESYLAILEEP